MLDHVIPKKRGHTRNQNSLPYIPTVYDQSQEVGQSLNHGKNNEQSDSNSLQIKEILEKQSYSQEEQEEQQQQEQDQVEDNVFHNVEENGNHLVNVEILPEDLLKQAQQEIESYEDYNNEGQQDQHSQDQNFQDEEEEEDSENINENNSTEEEEKIEENRGNCEESENQEMPQIKKKKTKQVVQYFETIFNAPQNSKTEQEEEKSQQQQLSNNNDNNDNEDNNSVKHISPNDNISPLGKIKKARKHQRSAQYYFKEEQNQKNEQESDQQQKEEAEQEPELELETRCRSSSLQEQQKQQLKQNCQQQQWSNFSIKVRNPEHIIQTQQQKREQMIKYYDLPKKIKKQDLNIKKYIEIEPLKADLGKIVPGEYTSKTIDVWNLSEENLVVNISLEHDYNGQCFIKSVKDSYAAIQQNNNNINKLEPLQVLIAANSEVQFWVIFEAGLDKNALKIENRVFIELEGFSYDKNENNNEKENNQEQNLRYELAVVGEKCVPEIQCVRALSYQGFDVIKVACKKDKPQSIIRVPFIAKNYNSIINIDFIDDVPNDYLSISGRPMQTIVDDNGNFQVNLVMRPYYANIWNNDKIKVIKKVLLLKLDKSQSMIYSFPIVIELC